MAKSGSRSSALSRREFGQRVAARDRRGDLASSAPAAGADGHHDAAAQDDRAMEKLFGRGPRPLQNRCGRTCCDGTATA